jgi:hypothetical protein
MGHSNVRHFSHLFLWQCQVQLQDVPSVKTTNLYTHEHFCSFQFWG